MWKLIGSHLNDQLWIWTIGHAPSGLGRMKLPAGDSGSSGCRTPRVFWDEGKIGHYTNLSLSHMERNDSLLIAASYFWSDALNAFLFGHGPMTPTLVDVLML